MSDLTTSLKEIFNERISSPFYGSLIVSWLLWNWKIPYVTFFVDQSRLGDCTNKIDYIFKHCNNPWHLWVFPVLSTAIILLGMPFITNGAYWITEKFDTWRINKKKEIQGKQLLDESDRMRLLLEMQEQEEKYSKLFVKKDEEIRLLKQQLDSALKIKKSKDNAPQNKNGKNNKEDYSEDLDTFLNDKQILIDFEKIANYIHQRNYLDDLPASSVQYCIAYGLIEVESGSYYKLTEKGKLFLKELIKYKNRNRIILQ